MVIEKNPELPKYDHHWPVTVYFNRWAAEHKAKNTARRNKSPKASSDSDSDKLPLRLASRQKGKFARKRVVQSSSDDSEEDLRDTADKVHHIEKRKRLNRGDRLDAAATTDFEVAPLTKRYYIGKNPAQYHNRASDSNNPPAAHKAPTRQESDDEGVHEWPHWCAFCGVPPVVSGLYTKDIRALFSVETMGILSTLGISHDLHFKILSSLDVSRRRNFLLSFVPDKISQFIACDIMDAIQKYGKHRSKEELLGDEDIKPIPCSNLTHQARSEKVKVSPELENCLKAFRMQELKHILFFIGIDSNERFQKMCGFTEENKRKMLYENIKEIYPSPFQKMMLELVLA
ncbi:hypothetical protein C8R43DRAFT_1234686 [Mycena crocata]|nr:hypothetical protein C8R43DRAFT_1234686 [Mycena crocata]